MESSGNLALTVQEIRHHGGAETGCQCGCEREVPLEGGEGGPGRDGLLCGAAQHPEDSRGMEAAVKRPGRIGAKRAHSFD